MLDVAVALVVDVDEAEVAGIAWALTTPSSPTPPMAANATLAVNRFSRRMPASLALIRASVALALFSMPELCRLALDPRCENPERLL
ncbi:MAG: hypothetical protein ABI334_05975 [Candidatus Dormiibacterota bacterium]